MFMVFGTTACITTETRGSFVPQPASIKRNEPVQAWNALSNEIVLGIVIHYANADAAEDSVFVVRNVWQQDLGFVDGLGRAWRFQPHEREPAWVGSGTLAQGVERILCAPASCTLIEIQLPATDDL